MPDPPQLPATWTITRLAGAAGVKPDTIRYYERIGLLPPAARTSGAHRRYGPSALGRLQFIQGAQHLGLRLEEISELLAVRDTGECACEPAAALLRRRLADLDAEMTRLAALRTDLAAMLAAIPTPDCPGPAPGSWQAAAGAVADPLLHLRAGHDDEPQVRVGDRVADQPFDAEVLGGQRAGDGHPRAGLGRDGGG